MDAPPSPPTQIGFAVLEFRRSPRRFLEILTEQGAEMLDTGAKILLRTQDVAPALAFMEAVGVQLGDQHMKLQNLTFRHVLVDSEVEEMLLEILKVSAGSGVNAGNCRDKMKIKRRAVVCMSRVSL